MTNHDHDADRFTMGERCRGVLELAIIVGIVVWTIMSSSLLMLPVLAAAAGLLVILAIWDDAACRRANQKAASARQHAAATRPVEDPFKRSAEGKRAA